MTIGTVAGEGLSSLSIIQSSTEIGRRQPFSFEPAEQSFLTFPIDNDALQSELISDSLDTTPTGSTFFLLSGETPEELQDSFEEGVERVFQGLVGTGLSSEEAASAVESLDEFFLAALEDESLRFVQASFGSIETTFDEDDRFGEAGVVTESVLVFSFQEDADNANTAVISLNGNTTGLTSAERSAGFDNNNVFLVQATQSEEDLTGPTSDSLAVLSGLSTSAFNAAGLGQVSLVSGFILQAAEELSTQLDFLTEQQAEFANSPQDRATAQRQINELSEIFETTASASSVAQFNAQLFGFA